MQTLQESTSLSTERFGFTLFLSICIHSVIILGIGVGLVEHIRHTPVLEVTLAQQHSELSAPAVKPGEVDNAQQQTTSVREMLTTSKADIKQQQRQEGEDIGLILSGLQAQLDRQRQAYASRPRRHTISSSSPQESHDARYLEDWRKRIEAVGNRHYPDSASSQGIYGNLRLLVAVRADGSVDEIRILSSSGHKLLDEAAVRIVNQAAPFAPFPDDMLEKTDILEIIRTWQFQPGDSFSSY